MVQMRGLPKSDDALIAVAAAEAMARRWREDIAILQTLKVVRLKDCEEPPIEIVRYLPRADCDV